MSAISPNDWKLDGSGGMTDKQRRMLNAVYGDLAAQLSWHGNRLSKYDWRHMVAGTILGWRMMPAIDRGEGAQGFIMLGGSSLKLSRSQAAEAITALLQFGDHPDAQGLSAKRVHWSNVVLLGLGFNPKDFAEAA
ncbi:recombination protein NinB [Stenotrophomonas maltophilia]|uniref:Recombination protein NinB n=1 Tax=Stenotrophomonas maltophilia TaxID=40324 RepID=A0AAJ2JC65_STEMA|nr:recombination protein NinB [Stenotrophomonas maltophilia]MDT3468649.1 recombination protein NinB [Stenotrophomonas maltophilia]